MKRLVGYVSLLLLISFHGNIIGASMKITSPAFKHEEFIPKKYTCEGDDISPALVFENVPKEAKSLVLICDDPDAPIETPWVHWVLFNLPATLKGLDENVSIASIPGAIEAMTNFNKARWGGPCPPTGHIIHRYYFKLYALDAKLEGLDSSATKFDVLNKITGHEIAQAELVGKFQR